ncbi:hypothetical protein TWF730_009410 [Orbilia blumenaviensis]|uniref:Uncharacterized protein n=1 Tax=Orbilia blumenaviensis TaxID=1796055 RepID=A0AAV9V1J0_9PEZI
MASVRALTCRLPLRKLQPVLLSTIRLLTTTTTTTTTSQAHTDRLDLRRTDAGVTGRKHRLDGIRPYSTDNHTSAESRDDLPPSLNFPDTSQTNTNASTSTPTSNTSNTGRRAKKRSKKNAKAVVLSEEDANWQRTVDDVVDSVFDTTTELLPRNPDGLPEEVARAKDVEDSTEYIETARGWDVEDLGKKKKKKKKKNKAATALAGEEEEEEAVVADGPAPITSILDFGLPNRSKSESTTSPAVDSFIPDRILEKTQREHTIARITKDPIADKPSKKQKKGPGAKPAPAPPPPTKEISLEDLFLKYESSIKANKQRDLETLDSLVTDQERRLEEHNLAVQRGAERLREEKQRKLDEEWEHNEDIFAEGEPVEETLENIEPARSEAAPAVPLENDKPGLNTGEPVVEPSADWLERLERRRAERKKVADEARQKAEAEAWSSEGRGLNTSVLFTQSAPEPCDVDLVWHNNDNYTPTQSYNRPTPLEPETILGRRIGDPSQLLSALSNGRNEYQYSLENLRLMRQGMEVAGLHERLRRTKLPFQFPAIKYEDIENIFRPRLPAGVATAYEPFPLIEPQESAVGIPFLWLLLENNSQSQALYGPVKNCQGYHPAPTRFFDPFLMSFMGYLKPTSIITDANYRQPYPRQQTIVSYMGIPTMVLLTVPSLPYSEAMKPRNIIAQLIAELFSCHYYNREIMQAQAPIIGLLHHDAKLWVVLYDPIADIPYVSEPIGLDLDLPRSHHVAGELKYPAAVTMDAFTCAAINGIEAMRHRIRQEGETDKEQDWRLASSELWNFLETKRTIHLKYPDPKDLPVRVYIKLTKELDVTRKMLPMGLQAVPGEYLLPVEGEAGAGYAERWWIDTKRPGFDDLKMTQGTPKQVRSHKGKGTEKKKDRSGHRSEPEPKPKPESGMGGYEYLKR